MSKKEKVLAGVSFFIFTLLVLYLITEKKKDEEQSENDLLAAPPPPRTINTGSLPSQPSPPLDPYMGEGKTAIDNQIKSILRNSTIVKQIVSDNGIHNDILKGVGGESKFYIKTSMLENMGISSETQIPTYNKMDSQYEDALNTLLQNCKNPAQKNDSMGDDEYLKLLQRSSDFSSTSGLIILPTKWDYLEKDFINDAYNGGSSCWGGGCRRDQRVGVANDLSKIANNLLEAHNSFKQIVFDFAAQRLVQAGWNLIGYSLPVV